MNATGGTPFLVSGVVDDLREEGIAPSAEASADVERIGVRVGGRSVRLQLSQLPAHAGRLAKALAVLQESDLPTAARLAGLDEADGAAAYTELVSAGIFCSGQPLAFAHPILAVVCTQTCRGSREHRFITRRRGCFRRGPLRTTP
jgi:hypothetical protein